MCSPTRRSFEPSSVSWGKQVMPFCSPIGSPQPRHRGTWATVTGISLYTGFNDYMGCTTCSKIFLCHTFVIHIASSGLHWQYISFFVQNLLMLRRKPHLTFIYYNFDLFGVYTCIWNVVPNAKYIILGKDEILHVPWNDSLHLNWGAESITCQRYTRTRSVSLPHHMCTHTPDSGRPPPPTDSTHTLVDSLVVVNLPYEARALRGPPQHTCDSTDKELLINFLFSSVLPHFVCWMTFEYFFSYLCFFC